MDSKQIREAMALRERAVTRVKNEINRIMVSHPSILGADGNALGSSQDLIAEDVLRLMDTYIQAPTMMEQAALPTLGKNTIEGASLSLMSLVALTVFEPTMALAPNMGAMVPHMFMFLLGYVTEKGPIPQNGLTELVEDVAAMVNLTAKTEDGVPLVMGEDLEAMKLAACNELLVAMTSQCVAMGFITMTEDSLEMSPKGDRLFRHLIAVNHWIQTLQTSLEGGDSLIVQG